MDDNKALVDEIRPEMQAFIRAVDKLGEGFFVSGFAFNFEEDFLLHFGNISPEADLLGLHRFLTISFQHMFQQGHTSSIESHDPRDSSTKSPEDIAGKLAAAIFSAPPEAVPEQIRNIASEYLTSRLEGR